MHSFHAKTPKGFCLTVLKIIFSETGTIYVYCFCCRDTSHYCTSFLCKTIGQYIGICNKLEPSSLYLWVLVAVVFLNEQ